MTQLSFKKLHSPSRSVQIGPHCKRTIVQRPQRNAVFFTHQPKQNTRGRILPHASGLDGQGLHHSRHPETYRRTTSTQIRELSLLHPHSLSGNASDSEPRIRRFRLVVLKLPQPPTTHLISTQQTYKHHPHIPFKRLLLLRMLIYARSLLRNIAGRHPAQTALVRTQDAV